MFRSENNLVGRIGRFGEDFHFAHCRNVGKNCSRTCVFAVGGFGNLHGDVVAVDLNVAEIVTVHVAQSRTNVFHHVVYVGVFVQLHFVSCHNTVVEKTASRMRLMGALYSL